MKRISMKFLALGLLLLNAATAAQAQTLQSDGWWGYYTDGQPRGDVGTDEAETYNAAIFVPGDDPAIKGMTIDKVRLYIRDTSYMENLRLWMSTKLPPRVALANVMVQDIDLDDITGGNDGYDAGLPNEIALDEPYTLTSKGVWVGYTFTITHVESEYDWDNASPLATVHGMESLPQASMFMFSMTMPEWFAGAYILPYCNFCTQVHLTSGTEGIAQTPPAPSAGGRVYDLQGRQMGNLQTDSRKTDSRKMTKGLYIVNGRKMIVR